MGDLAEHLTHPEADLARPAVCNQQHINNIRKRNGRGDEHHNGR